MSAEAAETQAAPGAGSEVTPQETVINNNVKEDDDVSAKATGGNRFQQAISAWRST